MKCQRRTSSSTKDRISEDRKRPLIRTPSSKRFPKDFFNQSDLFKHKIISIPTFTFPNKMITDENQFTFRADDYSTNMLKSNENEECSQSSLSQVMMKKANSCNQNLPFNQIKVIKRRGRIMVQNNIKA